jgi:hypothetical protein
VLLTRAVDVVGEIEVDVVVMEVVEETLEVEIAVKVEKAVPTLVEITVLGTAVFIVDTVVYVVTEHESRAKDTSTAYP